MFFTGGIFLSYFFIVDGNLLNQFTMIPNVACKKTTGRLAYSNITVEYFLNNMMKNGRIKSEAYLDTDPYKHYFVENDGGFEWCSAPVEGYIQKPGSTLYARKRGSIQF